MSKYNESNVDRSHEEKWADRKMKHNVKRNMKKRRKDNKKATREEIEEMIYNR